jgi:transposase-like protein/IS1 family transposase
LLYHEYIKCPSCNIDANKFGRHRNKLQRFRCPECGKTFTEAHAKIEKMNMTIEDAERVLTLLLEGMSVRSTERITGIHRDTILKLLGKAGERCEKVMGKLIVNVPVKDVQIDEIWGYIKKKEGHKTEAEANDETIGDAWCFVGIERHSKLVLNFALGRRNKATCDLFIEGLRAATAPQKFQLTSDGLEVYKHSVSDTLADRVSFAQCIKVYKAPTEGEGRYSPSEIASMEVVPVLGNPDPKRICTSHVERQNLTMRMQMRRFTRLTNGFSKKWENLWSMLCLYFAWYNFVRIHRSLRVTPAMEAGIADHAWSVRELLETT